MSSRLYQLSYPALFPPSGASDPALDDAEGYERILADLMREKNPVGVIETHRVKCMALDVG